MPKPSFFEAHFGKPFTEFATLNHEQRASAVRSAVPDLHRFIDAGATLENRDAPERTRELAVSLRDALASIERHGAADEALLASLDSRIVTDALLRSEADRDQNVYLGGLFTRSLTKATPDVIVQPASLGEAAQVFRWARRMGVPVTLRGAASTAMGGSVPNDAGVTLDVSRLDSVEIDEKARACVIGAGARLRDVHRKLADRGLALPTYPSNLGGTLAGWFVTGGIGMNAFGSGRAADTVLAADVILPDGEHVRFHGDGRLDVNDPEGRRLTLTSEAAAEWFRRRGAPALTLADLAGSEGVFGLVLHLTVAIEARRELAAFLLAFDRRDDALAAARWIATTHGSRFQRPANVKMFSGSHMNHVRHVWEDEDSRAWKQAPSAMASAHLPWFRIIGPTALGATTASDRGNAEAYLFVDFHGAEAGKSFAKALPDCPGSPVALESEAVRVAAERFKPQQTKRLGPGLLAAEIVMPAARLAEFLPEAEQVARGIDVPLDAEVYFLADDTVLVIAEYLTDHRKGSFATELPLAPALLDLAMRKFDGRPYVLGRWQAAYFGQRFGASASRVRDARTALDRTELVNRGVLTGFRLRGALGWLLSTTFVPSITMVRTVYGSPVTSWLAKLVKGALRPLPGPGAGRGAPAKVGAQFDVAPFLGRDAVGAAAKPADGSMLLAIAPGGAHATDAAATSAHPDAYGVQSPEDRAIHCVNCGECNSVCPIFNESKIRLPQMLTHIGESMRHGQPISETGSTLLDLCMRCGNCEEVCQAGIPHLPLYDAMQRASDAVRPPDTERHTAIVASVRSSSKYRDDFLDLRGGMYLRRSPASLPGVARFVVMRSENDAGPASSCIHCGACVPVCPTHANREFEGADPRWITTVQSRCIGCGSCVEVCPANLANGGRTLRVMEAPTGQWFDALQEFQAGGGLVTPTEPAVNGRGAEHATLPGGHA